MKKAIILIVATFMLGLFFSFPYFAHTIEGGFLSTLTTTEQEFKIKWRWKDAGSWQPPYLTGGFKLVVGFEFSSQ